jgi:nickel/cobalt exporter
MTIFGFSRPLLAGILHSFEPDHVTAVSVLATENAIQKRKTNFFVIFRASQWALGHSVTLLLFGTIALLFKSSLQVVVEDISFWAEAAVGPIMLWLGVEAVRRNHTINKSMRDHKKIEEHDHLGSNPIHLHGKSGEEIAMNPMNRSFWIGMLHGLAGTGGVLTSALVISASSLSESLMILAVESIGIIVAMAVYSYVLITTMSRFLERNMLIFKWMNGLAGLASIILGCIWIYDLILA